MSVGAVIDLQNQTALQQAQDRAKEIAESSKNGGRTPGGDMGKYDFLILLSAQLRHQDPLEPQSDSDFAAQLAQFSSLEQMQNMNATLEGMMSYQSYSLIGRFVMAEAVVDGEFGEIFGQVESIFTQGGVTFAQIGEYVVPMSSIREVFDTNSLLTTEMFMQTSNMLIGRTVIAEVDGKEIEGTVTRIYVENGSMHAQLDDGTNEPKFIPVGAIVDIRQPGTEVKSPKTETPPGAMNFKPDPNGNGFIELSLDGKTEIGRWDWSDAQWKWVYTQYSLNDSNEDDSGEDSGVEESEGAEAAGPEGGE